MELDNIAERPVMKQQKHRSLWTHRGAKLICKAGKTAAALHTQMPSLLSVIGQSSDTHHGANSEHYYTAAAMKSSIHPLYSLNLASICPWRLGIYHKKDRTEKAISLFLEHMNRGFHKCDIYFSFGLKIVSLIRCISDWRDYFYWMKIHCIQFIKSHTSLCYR